jgi:hypothetical protein
MPRTSECGTMAETFLNDGWHFVGADATNANFCIMEWRSEKPPVARSAEVAEGIEFIR